MAASPQLVGQTLDHYRIIEQIGAGGMGIVYRAHDEQLDRDVAVKVLPPGLLADEAARSRFRKEALLLAKLDHPNIATVHEFGSHGGVDFLVTAYIPGATLDAKLAADGALPEPKVVSLGLQLAEGLAAAHAHGVIHRDLKPGNLRLTPDGRLKILDFGLARLVEPEGGLSLTATLTQSQEVTGTLPYMAPEQLRGEKVDARSDIWAAGTVLYELVTGQRPFEESVPAALAADIIHKSPRAPRRVKSKLSPNLEAVILRCLEKAPARRYQSAREFQADLRRLELVTAQPQRSRAPGTRRWLVTAGVSLLLILLAGVALVVGLKMRSRGSADGIKSLAVLPLENLSGDKSQDYFADGMTEELITEVARVSALRVISRTSVMQYKNSRKTIPEIGRQLNVDAVLEGSVLRDHDRIRITAQLIETTDDKHIWADEYDRDLRDMLSLQSEVARAIARQVNSILVPQRQLRVSVDRKLDPQATDAYLRGLDYLRKGTGDALRIAIGHFERAIALDPTYALPYSGLADSYVQLSEYYQPPREGMPKAKEAAIKAIQLDDRLSDAHVSMGNVAFNYDYDWATTEREVKRAIELNASNANAHDLYGSYLIAMGRVDDGVTELELARKLDPQSPTILADIVLWLAFARRYDMAIEIGRKAIADQPAFAATHASLQIPYAIKGDFAHAIEQGEMAHKLDDNPLITSFLATTYSMAGDRPTALRVLAEVQEARKTRYSCSYEVATAYLWLGDKDSAFRWFDNAYDARSDCMNGLKADPRLDNIRSDPRYRQLLRRLAFP